MDYALIGLLAFTLICLAGALWQIKQMYDRLSELHERSLAQAQDERRELLNRIQHPERMPVKTSGQTGVRSNVSPETRRALAQVGHVAPQVIADGD